LTGFTPYLWQVPEGAPQRPVFADQRPTLLIAAASRRVAGVVRGTLDTPRMFAVTHASSGSEAMAIARREHPLVIILDTLLPDMHGYTVCQHLRAEPELQHAGIIITSEDNTHAARFGARANEADLYLARPFDAVGLLRTVDELLSLLAAKGEDSPQGATCRPRWQVAG
jgi:DNA-binding response OmpR family regulator